MSVKAKEIPVSVLFLESLTKADGIYDRKPNRPLRVSGFDRKGERTSYPILNLMLRS